MDQATWPAGRETPGRETLPLLLACLALRNDEAVPAELARLPAPVWEEVAEQASAYDVASLLYQRLKTSSPALAIPLEAEQVLAGITLYNSVRNQRLSRQLAQVLSAFRGTGLPVIVLKGAHLGEIVYGNMALRLIGDIDLLVPRSELPQIEHKLLEMGYIPDPYNQQQARIYGHLVYGPPAEGVRLELHWSIARPGEPFKVDVEGLWQRARPAQIAGIDALVLSPEDLILHVCLHTSYQHHYLTGLRPFCDLNETIHHYGDEIRWDQLRHLARQSGTGNCVYLTLLLARKLLGTPVPDGVLKELDPGDIDDRVIAWAERRIFSRIAVTEDFGSDGWGKVRASAGLGGKLSAFLRICFPPPLTMARIYALPAGSKRIYLYYPVRLIGLLRRHAPRAWRLLRGDRNTVAWADREEARIGLLKWLAQA